MRVHRYSATRSRCGVLRTETRSAAARNERDGSHGGRHLEGDQRKEPPHGRRPQPHPEPAPSPSTRSTCTRMRPLRPGLPHRGAALRGRPLSVHPESTFQCIACGQCMMVCPDGSVTVRGRGVSPDDLVDLPPRERRATAESLAALMTARRSVRRFTSRDVEPELLQQVVAMASSAPMGIPPWDVGCVVINGREKVREVAFEVARGYERMLKMMNPTVLALARPFMRARLHTQLRTFMLPLARDLRRALPPRRRRGLLRRARRPGLPPLAVRRSRRRVHRLHLRDARRRVARPRHHHDRRRAAADAARQAACAVVSASPRETSRLSR